MPNVNLNDPLTLLIILALAVFDVVLKAIAMWHASKNDQRGWFVVLFIFNTVGILPLIYLRFFQKKR